MREEYWAEERKNRGEKVVGGGGGRKAFNMEDMDFERGKTIFERKTKEGWVVRKSELGKDSKEENMEKQQRVVSWVRYVWGELEEEQQERAELWPWSKSNKEETEELRASRMDF